MNIKQRRLPSAYQEVEWIGSDGNSYITTGVVSQTGDTTTYDEKLIASDVVYSYRMGITGQSGYKYSFVCYNNTLRWCTKSKYFDVTESITAKHTYEYGNDYLRVDGVSKASGSDSNVNASENKTIFKSVYGCVSAKIYYYSISQSNVLLAEFIPCYRISDSVIGMYDTIGGTFYTNQGSGTFTKGADVVTVDGISIPQGDVRIINDSNSNCLWTNLKFNQLISGFSGTRNGITATINPITKENTFIGTATSETYIGITAYEPITSHCFYVTILEPIPCGRIYSSGYGNPNIITTGWGSDRIISGLSTNAMVWIIPANNTVNYTMHLMWIDLTAMYGAGFEPTDVNIVKRDCANIGHPLTEYQPYTPIW